MAWSWGGRLFATLLLSSLFLAGRSLYALVVFMNPDRPELVIYDLWGTLVGFIVDHLFHGPGGKNGCDLSTSTMNLIGIAAWFVLGIVLGLAIDGLRALIRLLRR